LILPPQRHASQIVNIHAGLRDIQSMKRGQNAENTARFSALNFTLFAIHASQPYAK